MDPQRWLSDVHNELQKRRLPRRYVTRLLRELSDHVSDGSENAMSKDARQSAASIDQLGLPESVAFMAEKEFHRRRFAARFPILSFIILPVLAFPFVAAATFAGPGWVIAEGLPMLGIDKALGIGEDLAYAAWIPTAMKCYSAGAVIVASALVVGVMARVARRSALRVRWPLVSAVLVALVAGCIWCDATPKTPDKPGMVMLGLGYPVRAWTMFQVAQLLTPLTLALWLTGRREKPVEPSVEQRLAA